MEESRNQSTRIEKVCVFCGSSLGSRSLYEEETRCLGEGLAKLGLSVIYGGGGKGLMGVLADAVTAAGGTLSGVTFHYIAEAEKYSAERKEHIIVSTPHERRERMHAGCDAYITLPGGLGTLEELAEAWCWAHLGLHRKTHWLVNIRGYFDRLLEFVDQGTQEGFFREDDRNFLRITNSVDELLKELVRS